MEPVTHALATLALARAGFDRVTPRATAILLLSGLAADIDWLSYPAGASAFLTWHRTATHSLVGTAAIAIVIAAIFWLFERGCSSHPLRFAPALAIACVGAALHLLLDLTGSYGVKLLWPFSPRWYAWDLTTFLDPWLVAFVLAALFLPTLFRMVSAEIGARQKRASVDFGTITILAVALLYLGARASLHEQASRELNARRYHGAQPIRVNAFPETSPFDWRGVVETNAAMYEIDAFVPGDSTFDPERASTLFKPMESPMLDRARQTAPVREFLSFARFPLATVEPAAEGYEVRIRDLRFASAPSGEPEIEAVVNFSAQFEVTASKLKFAAAAKSSKLK